MNDSLSNLSPDSDGADVLVWCVPVECLKTMTIEPALDSFKVTL
jgi:hypothetical protein